MRKGKNGGGFVRGGGESRGGPIGEGIINFVGYYYSLSAQCTKILFINREP